MQNKNDRTGNDPKVWACQTEIPSEEYQLTLFIPFEMQISVALIIGIKINVGVAMIEGKVA